MSTTTTTKAKGILLWSKRKLINSKQSAWYDHNFYEVPVRGTVDPRAIRSALSDRFRPQFTNFGGFTTVGDVETLTPGSVKIEMIYHIGE